jgi:hypothetical protein
VERKLARYRLDAISNRSKHRIGDGVSHFHIEAAMRASFGAKNRIQATKHAMNSCSADSCGKARINAWHKVCWHQRGLLCPKGTTQSALSRLIISIELLFVSIGLREDVRNILVQAKECASSGAHSLIKRNARCRFIRTDHNFNLHMYISLLVRLVSAQVSSFCHKVRPPDWSTSTSSDNQRHGEDGRHRLTTCWSDWPTTLAA